MAKIEPHEMMDKFYRFFSMAAFSGYRPPKLAPDGRPYATFNRRLMANIIDMAIVAFALIPFNDILSQYIYSDFHPNPEYMHTLAETAKNQQDYNQMATEHAVQSGFGSVFVKMMQVQYSVFAGYCFLFWHFYAATPGKLLLQMRVVDSKTGKPITDWQSFLRIGGFIMSAVPFFIGYFWVGISKKKQAWHDMFAGTSVVVISTPKKEELTGEDEPKSEPEAARPSDSQEPEAQE